MTGGCADGVARATCTEGDFVACAWAVNGGFAIGAASLAELTTLPLLKDILQSMRGDGQRIANAGNIAQDTVARLLALGRIGKAAGHGLYDYDATGRSIWPGLAQAFPLRGEPDQARRWITVMR